MASKVRNMLWLLVAYISVFGGVVLISCEVIDVPPTKVIPLPTPYPGGWKP